MKKIYFYFKSGEDIIYDGYINALIKNDTISFNIDESIYRFYIKDKKIERKSQDIITTIDINNKMIIIELLELKKIFDLPINIKSFMHNNEIFELQYIGEEQQEFIIMLKYS